MTVPNLVPARMHGRDQLRGEHLSGVPAEFPLTPQHVVVFDEAGMVDQELSRAFLTVVDEAGASFVLTGDRAQKVSVRRGGSPPMPRQWLIWYCSSVWNVIPSEW